MVSPQKSSVAVLRLLVTVAMGVNVISISFDCGLWIHTRNQSYVFQINYSTGIKVTGPNNPEGIGDHFEASNGW